MNARTLMLLAIAAAVALAGGFWASSMRDQATVSGVGAPLLAGLEEQINDVAAIRVYTTGEEPAVTIRRGDDAWRVEQKDDYRADYAKVRKLLLALSDADLLEEKTSNPEYYSRIGVQDAAEGGNVGIELDGVSAPRIVVGNREHSRGAFYTRRANEPTSWLASGDIDAPTDALQWLDRGVIDLPAARVAEVEIGHADGETLGLSKSTFGQANFDVAGVPEDAELERANIADPIGSVLASLRFDDVASAQSREFPEPVARITWRTFDGLVIAADVAEADGDYLARFKAGTDAAIAAKFQDSAGDAGDVDGEGRDSGGTGDDAGEGRDSRASGEDDGAGSGETVAAEAPGEAPVAETGAAPAPPDMSEARSQADELNDRLSGWVYSLPKYKYDQMIRRLADLLKSES